MRQFLILIVLCLLIGCSKIEPASGIYRISNDTESFTVLTLDSKNQSFVFCYDPLSSYLPCGTYTIKGNVLTAIAEDNADLYVFDIVDSSTLQIRLQDSTMNCNDDRICGIPKESQQFTLQE